MENTLPSDAGEHGPRRGPRGARPEVRNLSKPRAKIFELLADQDWSVAAMALHTGQHENTIREHLDALVHENLAIKYQTHSSTRGRPAWSYRTADNASRWQIGDYGGLAVALATFIAQTSRQPVQDAIDAGSAWAKSLVASPDFYTPPQGAKRKLRSAIALRERVVDLLAQLGFAPKHDPEVSNVELRQCPLLEAARQQPDVICAVHLGIVRGALREFGATPQQVEKVELQSFALQGACLLTL